MDIIQILKDELQINRSQAEAAVKLIDEGNTIPFIARYRKEATGSLNDEVLRNLDERLKYLRNLEERKEQVINSIREQEKLTPELEKKILAASTLVAVEDLYLPYRPKRKTRASIAKEKGLEPLANLVLMQLTKTPLLKEAEHYISEEKGVLTAEEALNGAKDILAERIAETAEYRTYIRKATFQEGSLDSSARDGNAESVYEMYYNFTEPVKKAAGHRILALNRGEKEKILTVKITAPEEKILRYLEKKVITRENPETARVLREVTEDSYKRLISPAIEREIRSELTENAEAGAIKVFGKNLEQLLMQPPITGRVVLGWDPAFRTGCKLAVVDGTGKVLDTVVIYPTAPQNKVEESKKILKNLITKYGVSLISVGNGTASRESEQIIVGLLKEIKEQVQYIIVNEEDCVNKVGVDLNTASASLLEYISGINKTIAKNIVSYREENGVFESRRELLKVAKLGPKAFEQCAGFMRIQGGKNPLDTTSVHPESYKAAEALLKRLGYEVKELTSGGLKGISKKVTDYKKLSQELEIGEITLRDIVSELEKPARDPRDEMPKPILRTDVMDMKDLAPGMVLKGTVRNVIDFGAFVDIGVHQDGLVHISQMTDRYIKHPLEAVSVGDIVEVKVLGVDLAKKRISLTMKL